MGLTLKGMKEIFGIMEDRAINQSESSYREIIWEIVRTLIDPPNHYLTLIYLELWVRAEENT